VAKLMRRRAKRTGAPQRMRVLRRFSREGVRYVELQCGCAALRTMRESTYDAQRPECCKRCRLRAIALHGFEPELRGGGAR
jgi:hypothetical protein